MKDDDDDFFDRMIRLGVYNHIGTDDEVKIIELPPVSGEEMARRLIRLWNSDQLSADDAIAVVQDAVIHARSARDTEEWELASVMVKSAIHAVSSNNSEAS
ncbi:MAG: hypothetical protein AAF317_02835 [Pseudomonadota bacterium]